MRGVADAHGLVVDIRHQAVHRGEQQDGGLAPSRQRFLFLFEPAQDFPTQRDDALAGFSQSRQALQIVTEGAVGHPGRQPLIGPLQVLHGAAETTLQNWQMAAVGKKQGVPQQQRGEVGLVIHGDQVPVIRQLGLGGALLDRACLVLQTAQPFHQVKPLVVGGDNEVALDESIRLGELLLEPFQGAIDGKALGGRFLDLSQVEIDIGKLALDIGKMQPDIGTVYVVHASLTAENGTGFKLAGFELVGTVLKLVDQVAEEGALLGELFGHRLVLL